MAEQPCYTLINNPSETEIPNEQQLRNDLGERGEITLIRAHSLVSGLHRAR